VHDERGCGDMLEILSTTATVVIVGSIDKSVLDCSDSVVELINRTDRIEILCNGNGPGTALFSMRSQKFSQQMPVIYP
jgi:hypothetical protein